MVIEKVLQKLPDEVNWDVLMEHMKNNKVQLGVLAGVSSSYFLYRQLTKKRYNLPPGPTALPLVGNFHSIGFKNLHLKFTELSKIYGPVFTVYLGPQRAIVLNSPQVTREAFVQKGPEFGGRLQTWTFQAFSDNGTDIAGAQYGPVWKIQRKIAHAALRKYALGEKLEVLVENAYNKISEELDKQEGPVDPSDYLLLFIYNVFTSMCFGREIEMDDSFVQYMIKAFKQLISDDLGMQFMLIDFFPFLASDIFGLKASKQFKEFMHYFTDFVGNEFDQHLENYDPGNLHDFMDEVIYHWKEAENEKEDETALSQLTKKHFINIILDIFSAGTDTTRLTIGFVFLYLAKFPEIQKKVHDEIDNVLGSRKPSVKSRDELHYLYAVLHEVMRLTPIVPAGVPHMTMCDTTIGKYDIPQGTMVFSNFYAMQHEPTAYKDPENFNPDRWLDHKGKINTQAGPWAPFSMGTRVCVGESLAKVEIMMTLAFFLQRYRIESPPGVLIDLEADDLAGTLFPKPQKIFFKHRY